MRKVILILIIIIPLFMTGCSATYDLYIGEKLTDNIFLYDNNDILKNLEYYDMNADTQININNYSEHINLFENNFNYEREEYSNNSISGYNYKYTYNYNMMKKKSMIWDCYNEINIKREDRIIIETSNDFKCFDKYPLLEDVTINIHYSGNLVSTNAHSYEQGVYTWNFNRENNNNRIYLEVEKDVKNYTFDIIGAIILSILILISVIILWKYNKKSYSL